MRQGIGIERAKKVGQVVGMVVAAPWMHTAFLGIKSSSILRGFAITSGVMFVASAFLVSDAVLSNEDGVANCIKIGVASLAATVAGVAWVPCSLLGYWVGILTPGVPQQSLSGFILQKFASVAPSALNVFLVDCAFCVLGTIVGGMVASSLGAGDSIRQQV